jgi:hypothetical protein
MDLYHCDKNFKLVLFFVLSVLCRSVYCLCVNVYSTTATGWQPNCSLTNISYIKVLVSLSLVLLKKVNFIGVFVCDMCELVA